MNGNQLFYLLNSVRSPSTGVGWPRSCA